jgi:hypothetical protein
MLLSNLPWNSSISRTTFVYVLVRNFTAAEVHGDDLATGEAGLIEQVGEKHRDCSISGGIDDTSFRASSHSEP